MTYFAKNLKTLTQKLALSQASIENVVEKRQTTISNWINGKSSPDAVDLVKLSQFFGIPIDDLCLIDLSEGNLIGEDYIRDFKQKGNPKGNLYGNLKADSYHFFGEQEPLKTGLNETEESAFWMLLQLMRRMDQKLDQLGLEVREAIKRRG